MNSGCRASCSPAPNTASGIAGSRLCRCDSPTPHSCRRHGQDVAIEGSGHPEGQRPVQRAQGSASLGHDRQETPASSISGC
eukprot:10287125-Lingulodinium_polyedra.AAC.1